MHIYLPTYPYTLIKLLYYYTFATTQINVALTSSRFAAHRRRRPGPWRMSLDRAAHREGRGCAYALVDGDPRRPTESRKMTRSKITPTHENNSLELIH